MICSFDLTHGWSWQGELQRCQQQETRIISWWKTQKISVPTRDLFLCWLRTLFPAGWDDLSHFPKQCHVSEQPRNKTLAWVFVCFARVVSIFLKYESHDLQITCIWADCLIRRRRGRGDVPRDGPRRRRLNAFCSHLCGNKSRKCSSWKLDTLNETWGRFIRVRDRKLKHLVLYMFNVSVQRDEFTYYGLVLPSHGHHMVMCLEP